MKRSEKGRPDFSPWRQFGRVAVGILVLLGFAALYSLVATVL